MGVVRQDVNRSAGSSGLRGRVSVAEVGQRTIISCTDLVFVVVVVLMLEEDACCGWCCRFGCGCCDCGGCDRCCCKLKDEVLLVESI